MAPTTGTSTHPAFASGTTGTELHWPGWVAGAPGTFRTGRLPGFKSDPGPIGERYTAATAVAETMVITTEIQAFEASWIRNANKGCMSASVTDRVKPG